MLDHQRGASSPTQELEKASLRGDIKPNLIGLICGPRFDGPHIGGLVGGRRIIAGPRGVAKDQILEELEWLIRSLDITPLVNRRPLKCWRLLAAGWENTSGEEGVY